MKVEKVSRICPRMKEALKSSMNDNEIIIKPANKGSAVVIWSKHDYFLEASNQLSDTNVYYKSIEFQNFTKS